jgi:hypothetical protein
VSRCVSLLPFTRLSQCDTMILAIAAASSINILVRSIRLSQCVFSNAAQEHDQIEKRSRLLKCLYVPASNLVVSYG